MVHIKSHIVQRILEVLRKEARQNALPFQIHSLLTTERPNTPSLEKTDLIKIQIPIQSFVNLTERHEDYHCLLNLKQDSVIHKVCLQNEKTDKEPVITFSIHKDIFIKDVLSDTFSDTGMALELPKKNIVVEYSSPNIAKPFHMGHLRSTIVGNFVANVKETSDRVFRLNYLGDWGTQVGFVKVGLERLGLKPSQLRENPVQKMYEAYVKANEDENLLSSARLAFSKLEKGEDKDGMAEWEAIRCITSSHLEAVYKRLGIYFDEYAWESNYMLPKILPIIKMLENEDLLKRENGHLNIKLEERIIPLLKSDGSTLYLSRDIAAALHRVSKYNCDSLVYIVDKSQSEHLKTLKQVMHKLVKKDIVQHIPFGRVIGMSTRKGTGIFLSDILDKATELMSLQQAKSPNTKTSSLVVTNTLAVSTLKVYVLKQRRMRDFKFNWELALQGTGDSGVKLQYTHCRLISLEKNCGVNLPEVCDPTFLIEPMILQLVAEIARFEEVVLFSRNEMESSVLINYLFTLCNLVSRCLKILPVKGQPKELAEQRLLLFHMSRRVLNRGMKILGLDPLDSM